MSDFCKNPVSALSFCKKNLKIKLKLVIISHDDKINKTFNTLTPDVVKNAKHVCRNFGSMKYVHDGNISYVVIGIGKLEKDTYISKAQYLIHCGAMIYLLLKRDGIDKINLNSPQHFDEHFAYGAILSSFTNGAKADSVQIGNAGEFSQNTINLAKATNHSRLLINTPFHVFNRKGENIGLNVSNFAKIIQAEFDDVTVYGSISSLQSINAGGLMAVGRASEECPQLIDVSYCHKDCQKQAPVVYVVKGMMFDSGGARLKPCASLKMMHVDMSSAATAFGMLKALKDNNEKANVKVIFCLTDNAIGPNMYLPGDYVTMMDETVVQMDDPDAEGRMVLYDGLVYAQNKYSNAKCYISVGTISVTDHKQLEYTAVPFYCEGETLSEKVRNCEGFGNIDPSIMLTPSDDCNILESPIPGVDIAQKINGTDLPQTEMAYTFLKHAIGSNLDRYIHFDLGLAIYGTKDIAGYTLPYASGTGWGVYAFSKIAQNL